MILQKSFWYADLMLKKHFYLLMLNKQLLFFQDSLINKKVQKNTIYLKEIFCSIVNALNVPFN